MKWGTVVHFRTWQLCWKSKHASFVVFIYLIFNLEFKRSQCKEHLWSISFWCQPRARPSTFPGRQLAVVITRKQSWNPQWSLPELWLKCAPTVSDQPTMFLSPRGETGVSAPDKCLDSTGTRLLWKQVTVVHRGTKASSRHQSLAKRTLLLFHIPANIEDYCALESCSVRIAIGGFISKHHSAVDMLVADVLQRSLKETFSKRQKLVASDFHRTELI